MGLVFLVHSTLYVFWLEILIYLHLCNYFFKDFIYFAEGERERERPHEPEEGQRERERIPSILHTEATT